MAKQDQNSKRDEQFTQRCLRYLEGELSADELQKFEAALAQNEAKARLLIELSIQETLIEELDILNEAARSENPLVAAKPPRNSICDSADQTPLTRIYCFFAQPTPLSMAVAAAVIGLLVTGMAFMAPPFYRAMTRAGEDSLPQRDSQRIVAELTAVHEAQWAPGQLTPNRGAFLQAGRRMELEQGLVELTFRGGAVVTMEGPSAWMVMSEGELQLEAGQAAADVPVPAIGFKVRTPTAEIVDLSTSFGVRATPDATEVHVFQGAVEATFLAPDGTEKSSLRVTEGKSVVWDAVAERTDQQPLEQDVFVRHVPRKKLLPVFSTGKGLAVGQADPHWTISNSLGDPSLKSQAAIVTALPRAIPNDADQSQWISNGHPPPPGKGAETFTFRMSFDLDEFDPHTAALRVRFAVDNLVTAMRLNGKAVSVPAHQYGEATFQSFLQTDISDGFEQGENILEIDVFNADDESYLGLRVELSGTALEQH